MKLTCLILPNRHGLGKGEVWQWFREQLPAGTELELMDATKPLTAPPSGRRVLLMGQRVLQFFEGADANIFTMRGSLLKVYGLTATATFDLQDAFDYQNMRHDNVFEESKSSANTDETLKDRAATSKSNWPFWVVADATKLITATHPQVEQVKFVAAPALDYYTRRLKEITNSTIYLDIEVSMQAGKLDCIGFAVNDSPIVVVPIYDYKHRLYYQQADTLRFLAALSSAMLRNRVVVHNAMFDLVYLPSECRLPVGKDIYDTMLGHQRIYPEVEKSLGHCISKWTWQPWHKGEGGTPMSHDGQMRYWEYNAKDVWCTRMVYKAQQAFIAEHPDYQESIRQVMASIHPYIVMTLTGVHINQTGLIKEKARLQARVIQLTRVLRSLTGLPKLNPASVDQLRKFFYDTLCYKAPDYTDSGKPALGEEQIYQLAMKYDNPVLQVLLNYRELDKELSMASFQGYYLPWREEQEKL